MEKLTLRIILIAMLSSLHAYTQNNIDSLEQILKNPPTNDRELYYTYVRLIRHYKNTDMDKALAYAHQGAMTAKEKDNLYWTADFYYSTGGIFHDYGQLDSALYYFGLSSELQAQAIEEGTEDKEENDYLTLYLLRDVGHIHATRGYFDLALELFHKGLAHAEQMNDPEELLLLYWHLADTYSSMSNYGQAEYYFIKMKQLASELKNMPMIADANLGLIPIMNTRGEYSKALEYGEEAYRLLLEQPQSQPTTLASTAMRISETWLKIPDYDKAMEYAEVTVEYARQTKRPAIITNALYTLSTAYLRKGQYVECEQTAFEALATDSSNLYVNSILYGNIAQANIWMGNTVKSIEYFGKTLDAHRAYSNQSFQSSLSEMEVKYETEKKEIQITELEKEKKLMAWAGISGIIILVLIAASFIFLWRWAVQKKRVAEQQHQIAEQQVKQLEQEKLLIATQAVLDGETAERTRLARDLHDGLGSMLTGVKMNLESIKSGVKDKAHAEYFTNTLGMVNESIHELRRVAHHLMPDSLSRYGLKTALSDFFNTLPTVEFDYFGNEERLDPQKEVMVYRIIHELVNNALKHSGASQIVVQVMCEAEYVAFIVRDNGSGFNVSSTTGGIGLRNIRDRVASFDGRMEIHSKPGEGTEINVELSLGEK